jgi:transcriptional regulator with XRE-family HTH domain
MTDERTANSVDREIGQRVRSRRLEINMSQERLAELLGITFQQVQKYEKGVNRIAASRLFFIADALHVPVARFFDSLAGRPLGVGETRAPFAADVLATPEGAQLVSLFASIENVKVRRKVVDLVRALADEAAEAAEER